MPQKTLDGKTDCRRETKGSIIIKMSEGFKEQHPEICEDLKQCHEKYPCIRMRINGKLLAEKPKNGGQV